MRTLLASVAASALVLALTACGSTVEQSGTTSPAVTGDDSSLDGSALGVPDDLAGAPSDNDLDGLDGLDGLDRPGAGDDGGAGGPGTDSSPGDSPGSGSSDSETDGSGDPTVPTTGAPGAGDSGSGPIKIGLLMPKKQEGTFLGVEAPAVQSVDVWRALVEAVNADGGVAGRRIVPVEAYIDAQASSYATEFQAACAAFTEDDRVALVLDTAAVYLPFEQCLQRAGVTHLHTGVQTTTEAELRRLTGFFLTDTPTMDRLVLNRLQAGLDAGRLSRGDTVGVLVESCTENVALYDDVLVPAARRLGLTVERADTDCTTGFASATSASSDISSAVLRFRSRGVDTVTFVSNYEAVGLLFFSQFAASQGWTPRYLLSSLSLASGLASSLPASQLPQMTIAGTLPLVDRADVEVTALDRSCTALARAGGLDVSTADVPGQLLLQGACGALILTDAALEASGGRADRAALVTALEGLGPVALPTSVGERNRFGAGAHDGPVAQQFTAYVTLCGCFRAAGPVRTLS